MTPLDEFDLSVVDDFDTYVNAQMDAFDVRLRQVQEDRKKNQKRRLQLERANEMLKTRYEHLKRYNEIVNKKAMWVDQKLNELKMLQGHASSAPGGELKPDMISNSNKRMKV